MGRGTRFAVPDITSLSCDEADGLSADGYVRDAATVPGTEPPP